MAQWVAIGVTALFAMIGLASLWGKMEERMRGQDVRIGKLEISAQSPEERKALAQVVHTELEAHSDQDALKFDAADKRMDTMEKALAAKLDAILGILTRGM